MRISSRNGAVFSTSYIFLAIVAVSHAFVFWIPVWKSTSPSPSGLPHHKPRHFSPRHQVRSVWKWRPVKSSPSLLNLNHHHPLCPLCHVAHRWKKPRKHHSSGGGGGGGEHHGDFFHHSPHHHHHHEHHHPKQQHHLFSPSNLLPRLRHHLSHLPKKLKSSFGRGDHHRQSNPDDGFLGPHHSFAKFNSFPKFGFFPKGMHDLPKFSPTKNIGGGGPSPHHHHHHHTPHKHNYNYHSSTKSHNLDNYHRNNPLHTKSKSNRQRHPPQHAPIHFYQDSPTKAHFPIEKPAQDNKYYDDEEDQDHYPGDDFGPPSGSAYPEEQAINDPAELVSREVNHSPSALGASSMESKDPQPQEGPLAGEEEFPKEFNNAANFGSGAFGTGQKGHGWGGWDW